MTGRGILIAIGVVVVIALVVMAISPDLFRSREEGGDPTAHSLQTE